MKYINLVKNTIKTMRHDRARSYLRGALAVQGNKKNTEKLRLLWEKYKQ